MPKYEFHGNWTIIAKNEEEAWDKFSNTGDASNYWIDTICHADGEEESK